MQRCLVGVLIIWLVVLPASLGAHARLMKSEPRREAALSTAPLRVQLWFHGRIETRFARLSVWNATGQQVDKRDVLVSDQDAASVSVGLPPLPPGTYSVQYRILSLDSHVSEGQFSFTVQDRQ